MAQMDSADESNIRILLVEDHLLTRIGLKTVLERMPDLRIVGEAENGEVAVKKVAALQPQIVLMDVGMPVMDGIEASRLIKGEYPDVGIIMLTSHDNERDIFASLAAGASGYCLKDVEPERLYSAIRSVTAGDVWLDSNIANKVLKVYSRPEQVAAPAPTAPAASDFFTRTVPSIAPETSTSSTAAASSGTVGGMSAGEHHPSPPLAEPLSPRELEVLALLVDGMSNQQIADKLIISLATVKTHVRNILNKLSVDDRTQAAVQAMRRGLVE